MGPLTNISLFSGAGGLDLGAKLVGGFKTICYVEWDRYAQAVLMSRMRDGGLDEAPLWDDVSTFDGKPWRGRVDVISGGFPCTDLSVAGNMRGIEYGAESGLWREFARIVGEVRPRFVLVENVPGILVGGGLGIVLGNLAEMGFDASWEVLSAASVGAPHKRERVFIVAYPSGGFLRELQNKGGEEGARYRDVVLGKRGGLSQRAERWAAEPGVDRMVDGVAGQMDRLRLCGNGVVPQQSAPAWQRIKDLAGQE